MSEFASPGITRRTALAAAGSATTLLLPMPLSAARRVVPEFSFLIVSDTHLGYRDQEHAAAQWQTTADELRDARGDFVLHLGDVVDGGREPQYPLYLEARQRIGKPVHEIPGNHDPAPLFEKYLRAPIDTAFDHLGVRFLLLNNARTDSHDGFLSAEQLTWLDDQCGDAARSDLLVFLAMHVPVHKNLHPDRGWYVKPEHGQEALYELLGRHAGRVLGLLHGHFHNGIRGWDDHPPVHEIIFPSALYNLDRRLEEQGAPGYNLKEFRPGYTLASLNAGGLRLEYKPVGADVSVGKNIPFAPA